MSARIACSLGCKPPPPPLQDTKKHQHPETRRQSAKETARGKQRHAGHIETLSSVSRREPRADRQHDAVGNKIAGEYPGRFVQVAPKLPAICGSAILAMEVSSTSINVARVTVMRDEPRIVPRAPLTAAHSHWLSWKPRIPIVSRCGIKNNIHACMYVVKTIAQHHIEG